MTPERSLYPRAREIIRRRIATVEAELKELVAALGELE
jgi:hypothetical protein